MARMTKKEALQRIKELANSEYPTYTYDGVFEDPIYTNWKTAEFIRHMDEYAERHPEDEMIGVDYADYLFRLIAENPDEIFFSPAGEYPADAWILRKWVEEKGMIGRAYLKIFDIETGSPVVDLHLD